MKTILFPLLTLALLLFTNGVLAQDFPFLLSSVSFGSESTATAVGYDLPHHLGTILHTTNGGETWTSQSGDTTGPLTGVSFVDANTGTAVGFYGPILQTTNGGITWTRDSSGTMFDLNGVSFSDANSGTAVGIDGTILHTTNGGTTWTTQVSGTTDYLYGVSFVDANTGTAVGSGGTILHTTDGGTTWVSQTSGTTNWLYSVSFVDANTGTAVGQVGTILRTIDGGVTWTSQSGGEGMWFNGVCFTDAHTGIAVGWYGATIRTTDGGTTWISQSSCTEQTLNAVSFFDADNGIVVADPGTILRTTNGGSTWLGGECTIYGPQFQTFLDRVNGASEPERMAIVDSFMAAVPSFPFVEQDSIVYFIYRGNVTSVNVPGDANSWSTSEFSMFRLSTTDFWYWPDNFEPDARLEYKFFLDGSTWISDSLNPRMFGGFGNSDLWMPAYEPPPEIEYDPGIPHGTLFDTTYYSAILSNSRVITVYTPSSYNPASSDSFPVVVFHDGFDYLSAGLANNVLDYLISQNRIVPLIGVFVPPVNRTEEYMGSQQDEFAAFISTELMPYVDSRYRTRRNPASRAGLGISAGGNISLWISYSYPDMFGNAATFSGDILQTTSNAFQYGPTLSLNLYVDTGTYGDLGLDDGRNFREILEAKGYPHQYIEWHEGHSWENWRAHVDTALEFFFRGSALSVSENEILPARFQLLQNYPNPFNPSTTIQFRVPSQEFVELRVYDVLGREVATLVNEELKPGSYETTFDGSSLANGVYFYRLLMDGKPFQTRKMLMIR